MGMETIVSATIERLISAAAIPKPSRSFFCVKYFVNTGINALVSAPMTRSSKMRFGRRNAAKYTPSSSGANRALSIRSLISPNTRDVNTMETRIMEALRTDCCCRVSKLQKRFIPLIIAIISTLCIVHFSSFCYNPVHANHETCHKETPS